MSLYYLDTGQLILWGSNAFGQLGLPQISSQSSEPVSDIDNLFGPVPPRVVQSNLVHYLQVLVEDLPSPVIDVACGLRHTLVVTGRMFPSFLKAALIFSIAPCIMLCLSFPGLMLFIPTLVFPSLYFNLLG